VPLKLQVPYSSAQRVHVVEVVGAGAGAVVVVWAYSQTLFAPGYGSPNTVLVQGVEPVMVLVLYFPSKPYRTCDVTGTVHVAFSTAQRTQLVVVMVAASVVRRCAVAVDEVVSALLPLLASSPPPHAASKTTAHEHASLLKAV
jgi:hypothetical protein